MGNHYSSLESSSLHQRVTVKFECLLFNKSGFLSQESRGLERESGFWFDFKSISETYHSVRLMPIKYTLQPPSGM